ncbi:ATP-binding protein [Bacillus sp. X1(2014)]|uniref:ATP-binding protein n=1 Tax=Bacillus sp. X1(2014) TaxID=1565991 RepID=UPI0011A88B1A|nr:ATP-binding protein [Bacillus sp. X1(2014)]
MDSKQYKQKLSNVFQINAITVDKDYFMLTHKPFKAIKMMSNSLFLSGEEFFHENDLYRIIMENRQSHQFHVVKGDNGSGKSHLIRWIKEHYENDAQNEAVIFISRMQSTLKGALLQIINSKVIQNHETSHRLKKLIDANEHLDNQHLKNIILAHFMVAVQEDDDSHEKKLKPNKRNNLQDYLSSQETREFLLKENGPIDRIQKKLAPGVNNEVMNDVDPHFVPQDFYITSAQAQELKKTDISKRALRLIGGIQESTHPDEQEEVEEFREELASYLNQFLDKVVQECLSLRGTDLKDIFTLLRQELKKEGKNLTLFIEDITSFTGVDKDLVEVLITDHKENDSLCRLISIVGITNGYYQTSMPGNIKDRITSHIEIDNVVIKDENECAELAARYINAVYLDDAQIKEWKKNGYLLEEFPIATAFKKHEWANFNIEGNIELTIFPFTKTALWNFFSNLEIQTPRNFLQTVLLQYIQKYTVDGPKDQFPPEIDKVKADFIRVPNWKDTTTELVLNRLVPNHLNDRYQTVFRIWGNGTLDQQMINEKRYVGGLEDDVFKTFGLEPIEGIKGSKSGESVITPNPDRVVKKPGGGSGSTQIDRKKPPVLPDPFIEKVERKKDPTVIDKPKNPELDEAISEIEKWVKGGPLPNIWMTSDLMKFIREYIHWDLEGIPAILVKDFFSPNYVLIEGQTKGFKVKEENALKFNRSIQLRYALVALAQYKYEGKGSWNFDGSHMALLSLHTWIELEKEHILSFLKKPYDYSGEKWDMEEYVIAAEFFMTSLMNGFTGKEKKDEEIYLQLVKNKNKDFIQQHSQPWVNVTTSLNPEHTDFFRRYFNKLQGDVKFASSTSTFFYDAYDIISTINKLKAQNFVLHLDKLPKGSSTWYTSVNIVSNLQSENLLKKAIHEELKHSTVVIDKINSILGDKVTVEIVNKTVKEMKGLLDYLMEIQEPFQASQFEVLSQGILDYEQIVSKIITLQDLAKSDSSLEQLVGLSNNPSLQVQPFYRVLDHFNKLMEEKSTEKKRKVTTFKTELSTYSSDPLVEVKDELNTIKDFISELHERSADHAVK